MQYSKAFNEERYLFNNPDVKAAVSNRVFASGFEHYVKFGCAENRAAYSYSIEEDYLFFKSDFRNSFNEEEYLTAYPDIRAAIQKGIFESGYEHYRKYGYFEGRIK